MSKFYGTVGYANSIERNSGVWCDQIVERDYFGDVTSVTSRWKSASDNTNDNLNIQTRISIVADPYAYDHFHEIKYVVWHRVKWKVSSVEVSFPRLILNVGDVYTEEEVE